MKVKFRFVNFLSAKIEVPLPPCHSPILKLIFNIFKWNYYTPFHSTSYKNWVKIFLCSAPSISKCHKIFLASKKLILFLTCFLQLHSNIINVSPYFFVKKLALQRVVLHSHYYFLFSSLFILQIKNTNWS